MTWNYRIMRRVDETPAGRESYYIVVEAYYDEAGTVTSWSQDAIHPQGEDVEALGADISRMLIAASKPVLVERDGSVVELSPIEVLAADMELAIEDDPAWKRNPDGTFSPADPGAQP